MPAANVSYSITAGGLLPMLFGADLIAPPSSSFCSPIQRHQAFVCSSLELCWSLYSRPARSRCCDQARPLSVTHILFSPSPSTRIHDGLNRSCYAMLQSIGPATIGLLRGRLRMRGGRALFGDPSENKKW